MDEKRRPGYLTAYAKHAGISKPAAAEQLKRVGIDYMQPFDFEVADLKRSAARSADRAEFSKPIYLDPDKSGESGGDGAPAASEMGANGELKNPVYAAIQARKEFYKAELARLEFEQVSGKLVEKEKVEAEAFRIAQLVRDGILNVPARLSGILAAETDQRKVHDQLEKELRQALEALALDDDGKDDRGSSGTA